MQHVARPSVLFLLGLRRSYPCIIDGHSLHPALKVLPVAYLYRYSKTMTSSEHQRPMRIGTHNGTFHCDDVLACAMLRCLPRYKNAEVVRSRDQSVLDTCDIVVDVGNVFNHENSRYDHHQRGFDECFNSLFPNKRWLTKLSSAGLIYVYYGREILSEIISEVKPGVTLDSAEFDMLYDQVYENFVEEIDAVDNGISCYDGQPRYKITSTISRRVGGLNPQWNEEDDTTNMERFSKAMDLVQVELNDVVRHYLTSWLPARQMVKDAIKHRLYVDESGEIVKLPFGGLPWKDHLHNVEKDLNIKPLIKYVLFPDSSGKWRVQCVPVRPESFENRLSLPEAWRGLRDDELSRQADIDGCVFVHINGFIGGNATYEGAYKMAKASLLYADKHAVQSKKIRTDE